MLTVQEKLMYQVMKAIYDSDIPIDFDSAEIMQTLDKSGRALDKFTGFLYCSDELRHAYEKFRLTGDVEKPPFEKLYATVKTYIQDVFPPS